MRLLRISFVLLVTLTLSLGARAIENTWDYSVQLSSAVQSSPARITLSWPQDTNGVPASYTVYRKAPGDSSWGAGTALPGSATSYADTNVTFGAAYEYRVVKATGNYTGYGYIQTGIEAPLVDNRGKVVLIVDNTFSSSLVFELARLQQDLAGDGWTVLRHDVSRTDSVATVKALIKAAYNADPTRVKSVFLFGHIAVPYSGQLNPDGHGDHTGAWPADVYYGDMDGAWTDSSVNYTQSINTDVNDANRLTNRPGDGKFDQTEIPSFIELQVGRVDLSNMPGRVTWGGPATFPNETEVMRKYLNKDHNFRHRITTAPRRAIVGDYFGIRGGESFSASGYRSFAPLVGANNVRNLNVEFNDQQGVWIPQVKQNDYLLAYACGAGSYGSISGIGSGLYNGADTVEMVNSNVRGVFNLLFGSWLGDWDHEDNILRAPLMTDYGLVSVWSGRPHWFIHPIGLGETFGYATQLTQNNTSQYQTQINSSAHRIHIALMGDPTLRLHPVAPAQALTGSVSGSSASLSWSASTDSNLLGYHVYRAPSSTGAFTRLTGAPATATTFNDTAAPAGAVYMVRAIKLENTTSGSYQNPSQGIFWSQADGSNSGGSPAPSTIASSGSTAPATTTSSGTTSSSAPSTGETAGVVSVSSFPASSTPPNSVVWFDDALPAGAGTSSAWNWVSASPAPYSGSKAHQSALVSGLHEYAFNWAAPLAINSGDTLFAHVYLDPSSPPSEVMLSWNSGNWEHRAFWGSNDINYGANATAGRYYMGPLPAAGQWVRLEIPAAAVALAGSSVTGMSFSLFNGRAALDATGKSAAASAAPTATTPTTTVPIVPPITTDPISGATGPNGTSTTEPAPVTSPAKPVSNLLSGDVPWFDDSLPRGASGSGTGGDGWRWVSSAPTPFAGKVAHQTNIQGGLHEHSFNWANEPLVVAAGEKLFVYVYLDPLNKPSELLLSWCVNGNWDHRAYWGADSINYGQKGTAGRYYAGPLPAAGQWVRLQVPASAVGLEGATINGMAFCLYDGRATWDVTGKTTATYVPTTPTTDPTTPPPTTTPILTDVVWIDDALPAGSGSGATGGDRWNWIASNPTPVSGSLAQQTIIAPGIHETSFNWASNAMSVSAGESVFAYVYIDPANVPSTIMLSWFNGDWEHRAFWGADQIHYGVRDTPSRSYAGVIPAAGQWVRLEVPASAVGLSGATVTGMGFSLYGGRVTWDKIGRGSTTTSSGGETTTPPPTTTTPPPTTTEPPPPTTTTPPPTTTEPPPASPTPTPVIGENSAIRMPQIGDYQLRIVSPAVLELQRITSKAADPATVTEWNFVNSSGVFTAPAISQFAVTINGQPASVKSVGFRRRVAYAPQNYRDLRIDNCLYLELTGAVAEGATVEVNNPGGALWPASMVFKSAANPLRYSPAIHVNQEGYIPSQPKKAMVGYYLGNLGELDVNAAAGFKLVSAATGVTVHQGALTSRLETGYVYSPRPYQKVYQADFSAFTTPGEYQLVVPGLGASLPFLINDGVAMAFARTYAMGVYHQRCGAECAMPYSRFVHAACHTAAAEVPSPQSSYGFTWTTIASKNEDAKTNPRHTAPRLDSEAAQLYPFVNKGTVDVSGGHHDAGDYSKYTINVAQLVHQLGFTAESIGGAGAMDNLGLPESGDGISDILQEAKQESDYVAKLQDADGGFYFIVYPKLREYEGNVTPEFGDRQVVWPKNTSATAASVAALAQMASSPKFKAAYPAAAATYLQKAKLGWQFLINAIARHGKDGAYQKVTFYGDHYMHDDELAWAAAEMFVATGEAQYHQKLMEWFPNPSDSNTFRYGWLRLCEGWGNAIRAYAFAARSGRLSAGQLDAAYLAKCEEQVKLAGDDAVYWSRQSAYGTSFPEASKHVLGAGWYFSLDQAADMAVAYQLNPKPEYMEALIANMNYEAGTNPVNVAFVSGLGLKRPRELVNQWANSDHHTLPMPGIPLGNITGTFSYVGTYGAVGNELGKLSYPSDDNSNTSLMTPFYDRYSDNWNVTAEFITMNQARAITSAVAIASVTSAKSTAWKPNRTVKILTPAATVQTGVPLTLSLDTTGLDLTNARITWEARDQEPDYGATYTVTPRNPGTQWVEAEIMWSDGRRLVGVGSFSANSALVTWLDDVVPLGANPGSLGGDGWNWVSSPTPKSGTRAHQTPASAGLREHSFSGAWTPLTVGTGDTLFAWVYLDPNAMPEELMLHRFDGSWDHRAYWGANKIGYGSENTAGRRNMGALPAGGGWVKLEVPASLVGLEGREINGMCFSAFGGGVVTWDAAGRTSPMN